MDEYRVMLEGKMRQRKGIAEARKVLSRRRVVWDVM